MALLIELFAPGPQLDGGFADFAIEAARNAFCPTGEGGGVDPTCSPGSPKSPITREQTTPCPSPCNTGHGDSRVGVPADKVPPPPPIGRLPNLTAHERRAESEFAEMYERDPDGVARTYREGVLATTKPGDPPTFETDGAKNLSPVWTNPDLNVQCQNRATLNTALHGTANAIAKRAFLDHLDTLHPGDNVLVTCGGCGSGKGYSLKNVPEALAEKTRSKAVWDSAGDQNASENRWIQRECERRGLTASYVHVTADPVKQWADPERGVVKRASDPKDGRMVDAKVFADSYTRGTENMRRFYEDNRDNPNAKFVFLDARGHKPALVNDMPCVKLPPAHELADFASSVAVLSDAPPHIVRGATLGARIWADHARNQFCPGSNTDATCSPGAKGSGTKADPYQCGSDIKLAAKLLSNGFHVQLAQPDQVATLIDKLGKAVAKGKDIDLCKVSVPGTNLFCQESLGIPRIRMPQMRGMPVAGTYAATKEVNKAGKVDLSREFLDHMREEGIKSEQVDVRASHLRASQDQIVGARIQELLGRSSAELRERPIFVTRDNYIVDGHHHWATLVAKGYDKGHDYKVPVHRLDTDIGTALRMANEFTAKAGLAPKSGSTSNANPNHDERGRFAARMDAAVRELRSQGFNEIEPLSAARVVSHKAGRWYIHTVKPSTGELANDMVAPSMEKLGSLQEWADTDPHERALKETGQ